MMGLKGTELDLVHSLWLRLWKDVTLLRTWAQYLHRDTDLVTDVYNPQKRLDVSIFPQSNIQIKMTFM